MRSRIKKTKRIISDEGRFVIPKAEVLERYGVHGAMLRNIGRTAWMTYDNDDIMFREDHPSWQVPTAMGKLYVKRAVKNYKNEYEVVIGMEIMDDTNVLLYPCILASTADEELVVIHLADLVTADFVLDHYQTEADRRYLSSLPGYCVVNIRDMKKLTLIQQHMLDKVVDRVQNMLIREKKIELV